MDTDGLDITPADGLAEQEAVARALDKLRLRGLPGPGCPGYHHVERALSELYHAGQQAERYHAGQLAALRVPGSNLPAGLVPGVELVPGAGPPYTVPPRYRGILHDAKPPYTVRWRCSHEHSDRLENGTAGEAEECAVRREAERVRQQAALPVEVRVGSVVIQIRDAGGDGSHDVT